MGRMVEQVDRAGVRALRATLIATDGDLGAALAALANAQARIITTMIPAAHAREALVHCQRLLRLWCAAGYRR